MSLGELAQVLRGSHDSPSGCATPRTCPAGGQKAFVCPPGAPARPDRRALSVSGHRLSDCRQPQRQSATRIHVTALVTTSLVA